MSGSRFRRRLGNDDRRTVDGVTLHGRQSFVGLIEGKDRHLGPKINFGGDLEEIPGIGASHVGHATKLPFSPEQTVVVKLGNPIQVNRVDRDHTTFSQTAQSGHDNISAGRKSHGAV